MCWSGSALSFGPPREGESAEAVTVMVRKKDDLGGHYREPPYTDEEIDDFYRRTGNGPIAWTRPTTKQQSSGQR